MPDPIVPPADQPAAVAPAPAPAAPPSALDQVPLGEYVTRRAAGEKPGAPASASPPAPEGPSDESPEPPPRPGETPEQAAAAKASRNRGTMQHRIDELVKQRGEYERRYQTEKQQREALEAKLAGNGNGNGNGQAPQQPQPQAPAEPQGPPDLDQMLAAGQTYEDWVDARSTWRAQEVARAQLIAFQAHQQQQAAQQQFHEAVSGFHTRVEAAKAKYPDYETVVAGNEDAILSPVMQDVALRSERGADIMYWLGKHPELATELGAMTQGYPPQAFPLVERHLLSLLPDAGASASRGASGSVPHSAAPAPITPLGGGSQPIAPPMGELSLGDYVRRRNEEEARRRGRS